VVQKDFGILVDGVIGRASIQRGENTG